MTTRGLPLLRGLQNGRGGPGGCSLPRTAVQRLYTAARPVLFHRSRLPRAAAKPWRGPAGERRRSRPGRARRRPLPGQLRKTRGWRQGGPSRRRMRGGDPEAGGGPGWLPGLSAVLGLRVPPARRCVPG